MNTQSLYINYIKNTVPTAYTQSPRLLHSKHKSLAKTSCKDQNRNLETEKMGCNIQCWCYSSPEKDQKLLIEGDSLTPCPIQPLAYVEQPQGGSSVNSTHNDTRLDQSSVPSLFIGEPQVVDSSPLQHEGSLLKYKPGISKQFVDRWIQITEQCLLCYKSIDSARLLQRPLLQIPFDDIKSVENVEGELHKQKFLFEVFLNNEDSMLKVSRETQNQDFESKVLLKTYARKYSGAVENGKLMKKPVRNSRNDLGRVRKNCGWSLREVEWYSAEKRLLFSAKSASDRKMWVSLIKTKMEI